MYRTALSKKILIFEIANIVNEKNVTIATGQGKKSVLILRDEFCPEQAFIYLLLKFGYNASRDIPISPAR